MFFLFQYFEREQARLEGIQSAEKRNRIMDTFATARSKARKLSNSITGGGTPLTYGVNAPPALRRMPHYDGGGVASSMNLWGGGAVPSNSKKPVLASVADKQASVCNLHQGTGTGSTQYSSNSTQNRFKMDRMNTTIA